MCGLVTLGSARCIAWARPNASQSPVGLSPATMKALMVFPPAILPAQARPLRFVDAYDDPTAANDLSVFSTQFGLPACTTANGCFTKVNQTGSTKLSQRQCRLGA